MPVLGIHVKPASIWLGRSAELGFCSLEVITKLLCVDALAFSEK